MRKSILMLRPITTHQDEFPAEYSLAGCSPAAPTSASPAMLILNQKSIVGYRFSANGNCPRTPLSQLTTQAKHPPRLLVESLGSRCVGLPRAQHVHPDIPALQFVELRACE